MRYVQGFLVPVKHANQQAYLAMATKVAPLFAQLGATRTVECWGDQVMDGKNTDMKKAVQATSDENVVFAWVEWPDKATYDAATARMMTDERMKPDPAMPFDGKRMIFGGFEVDDESGTAGRFGYVDGVVAAVPSDRRDAHTKRSREMAAFFRTQGATRSVYGWGTDVPDGKVTDFKRAVQATAGETMIFGWIEWPDEATRDAGMATLMKDERLRTMPPAWNGPLAIFGGYTPILDTDAH